MNGEIKSYHQLAVEYERYEERRMKASIEDRLFSLCMKHEADDFEICRLKAEDFGEDAEEAEELLSILGEMGAFRAKYECYDDDE